MCIVKCTDNGLEIANVEWRVWKGNIVSKRISLKMKNDEQDVSVYHRDTTCRWIKLKQSEDIHGFQHNIYGGFVSICPGIFVAGKDKATFSRFCYKGFE